MYIILGEPLAFRSWLDLILSLPVRLYNYRCLDDSLSNISAIACAGSFSLHDSLQTGIQVAHYLRFAHAKTRTRGHINCSIFPDVSVFPSLQHEEQHDGPKSCSTNSSFTLVADKKGAAMTYQAANCQPKWLCNGLYSLDSTAACQLWQCNKHRCTHTSP